jgi:hypothetical protein
MITEIRSPPGSIAVSSRKVLLPMVSFASVVLFLAAFVLIGLRAPSFDNRTLSLVLVAASVLVGFNVMWIRLF